MEAMAAGKPVVVTTVGGVAEIVRDGDTGLLVPPGRPAALREACVRLLQEPARALTMGCRGREVVASAFDIRRQTFAPRGPLRRPGGSSARRAAHTAVTDRARLARSTAHAMAWSYASFGLGKALVVVTTAVLARLLTPDTFGTLGFAVVMINVVGLLKDVGLGVAMIHRRGDVDQAGSDTRVTLSLLGGTRFYTVITVGIAPLAAATSRSPW